MRSLSWTMQMRPKPSPKYPTKEKQRKLGHTILLIFFITIVKHLNWVNFIRKEHLFGLSDPKVYV